MKKSSALLLAGTATAAAAATALAVGLKKNAARTDKPAAKKEAPFYLIRNGHAAAAVILPAAMYEEKRKKYCLPFLRLLKKTGVAIPVLSDENADDVKGNRLYIGAVKSCDYRLLGEATSYQFGILRQGTSVFLMAHTESGRDAALAALEAALVISEDGRNVTLPAAAYGIRDWSRPEPYRAFSRFTISSYGSPTLSSFDPAQWTEADRRVVRSIAEFGITENTVSFRYDPSDAPRMEEDCRALRAYITYMQETYGITSRLYGIKFPEGGTRNVDLSAMPDLLRDTEENVRYLTEHFGDLPGLSHWGFYDEPGPDWIGSGGYGYCRIVKDAFARLDRRHLPVYVNMGPLSGVDFACAEQWYDHLERVVNPDFYCFDRYPFFLTDEGGRMTDPYFYANLELSRRYAIDNARDSGMIVALCRVGGADSVLSDINQDFMDWQVNLVLAYGCRYLEHFVFYTGHPCGPYTKENEKTFRWEIGRNTNLYAASVGEMLLPRRLDAVFHLPNADGSYSPDTIPYYGYRGTGDVIGCDALLSFFDDGTVIVTDKRCQKWDGGTHSVTLTGMTGALEWFDAAGERWEDIRCCGAASLDENGLTLTLPRASQWIIRRKK